MNCSCGQWGIPHLGNCAPCFKMAMATPPPRSIGADVLTGFMLLLIPFLMASLIHHLLTW